MKDWKRRATPNEKQVLALLDGLISETRYTLIRLVGKRRRVVRKIKTRAKG